MDFKTGFRNLKMFGLDFHIDSFSRGSWVSLEVGEIVDVDVLLLRGPSREKRGAVGDGLHCSEQWRPILGDGGLARLPNLFSYCGRNLQAGHKHAVILIDWRVRDLKPKTDAVGLTLVKLLVP